MQLAKGEILCPHCFKVFQHSDVHFRSSHAHHLETDSSGLHTIVESTVPDMELYAFESKFYSEEYPIAQPKKRNPAVITDQMATRLSGPNYVLGAYHTSEEAGGIVTWAEDEFGEVTSQRLCPYCHGDLLSKSGIIDTYIVSLIGEVSSGKTVFKDALVHAVAQEVPNLGLGILIVVEDEGYFELDDSTEEFSSGSVVYESTNPRSRVRPIILKVLSIAEHRDLAYIVLYDSSGELVSDKRLAEEGIGFYIAASDAVIVLIDPLLTGLKDAIVHYKGNYGEDSQRSPHTARLFAVLRRVIDAGVCQNYAIALSKSDLLEFGENEWIPLTSRVFRKCSHSGGLDIEEVRDVDLDVSTLLRATAPQLMEYLSYIEPSKRSFFAFSSLGHDYVRGKEPDPRRVEEPLLWLLYRFGLLKARMAYAAEEPIFNYVARKPKKPQPLYRRIFDYFFSPERARARTKSKAQTQARDRSRRAKARR